jgi:hypothetical protein
MEIPKFSGWSGTAHSPFYERGLYFEVNNRLVCEEIRYRQTQQFFTILIYTLGQHVSTFISHHQALLENRSILIKNI